MPSNFYSKLTFSDEITGLVNEGRAVGIVYPDFRKAFDAVVSPIGSSQTS